MKVTADDDRFGYVVTPQGVPRFFRFQIIVDGRLVGDAGPCIIGSAMHRLGNLESLDDSRLSGLREDPVKVSAVLLSDDDLHDATTLSIAESLDNWLVQAYVHDGKAVFLARQFVNDERDELGDEILVSVLDASEYAAIFHAVHQYWLSCQ